MVITLRQETEGLSGEPCSAPRDPGRPPMLASIVCPISARESAANPKTCTKIRGPQILGPCAGSTDGTPAGPAVIPRTRAPL
jgi:hypothetical protein